MDDALNDKPTDVGRRAAHAQGSTTGASYEYITRSVSAEYMYACEHFIAPTHSLAADGAPSPSSTWGNPHDVGTAVARLAASKSERV